MTMTTTTEDITLRLASLEDAIEDVRAEQRETNARLDALTERTARLEGQVTSMDATMSAGLSDMRAEIREVHNRMNLMQADTNARLDSIGERMERMQASTDARIDKVFWGVVGVGVTIGGGIIGALVAIAFRIAN